MAAGGSSRLGRPKQLLMFEGATLLTRAIRTAAATGLGPVIAVLGSGAEDLVRQTDCSGAYIAVNPRWRTGIGSSIRVGVRSALARERDPEGIALVLCDQPLVTSDDLGAMARKCEQSDAYACAASHSGTLGTPAIFSADAVRDLLALGDAQSGKSLLVTHAETVVTYPLASAAVDIDVEADYQHLLGKRNPISPSG
jgi:molybdenum cofactor cytidylyltransferase